jgi:hypothetical protein
LYNLVINNLTNEKIFVTKTAYYADTTKANSNEFICANCKSSSSTDIYKQYIRLDIFVLDSSYSDTIFSRTINLVNFDSTRLTIDILPGLKLHLTTIHPIDRLNIHADNRDLVFKISDKIEIKTIEGFVVKGQIKFYNDSSLTVEYKSSISTINFEKLHSIKLCRPKISISASRSLFNKCLFYNIDNSMTKTVRQQQIKYSNGHIGWDWR